MQRFARVVLVVAATIAASCGDSSSGDNGGTPASPSTLTHLTGSWKATRAEFVSASNSSVRVEVVGMGTSLTLALVAGGTYTQTIVDPGHAGQTTTGTWTATQEILTLKPAGKSGDTQFNMTLSGATLTLSGGHVAFDVNGDGLDDEALANLTLARQ